MECLCEQFDLRSIARLVRDADPSSSRIADLLTITHAEKRVTRYREAMLRGERFPPVSVVRLLGRWLLADGHKRLAAFRSLGVSEIVVEVWPWSRWFADQWRQARDNADKNRRIAINLIRNPAESVRLTTSTLRHWKRVAMSLTSRAR